MGQLVDSDKMDPQTALAEYRSHLEEMAAARSDELLAINKRLYKEIEDRRKAEEALLANEQRYRKVFENTGTATILIESDRTISMANARALQLIGLPQDKIVGCCKLTDFVAPAHRDRIIIYHELRMRCDPNVPQQFEFQIIDAQGRSRDVLANVQWIPGNNQTIASMLDITESNKLAQERRRLAAVIDQSDAGIIITDNHGRVQYVNQAFENLSGFNRTACIGQSIEAPFFCDQDRKILKQMTFMVSGDDSWTGRFKNRRNDGHTYIADTRIFAVCDDRGKVVNLVCCKTDVTHEVLLEKQLQQAQKMEAIGTLAGGIAHDFNNILAGILGYAEISLHRAGDNVYLKRNLTRILDGCHRAKELVKNILTFSRSHDEKVEPLEIQIIVKEALKLLRASVPSTIEFKQHIKAKPIIVCARPTQVHQVVMNLCANAAQAMHSRGGQLEVRLEKMELASGQCESSPGLPPGPYCRLTVRDTGEGIDPENLERIFEPYFTTKEQTGGTGLGLSVVHGIVTSIGGNIAVESRPGLGTLFTINLPMVKHAAKSKAPAQQELPRGEEHILVVDDEDFILEIMADMLRTLGYNVETANSGMEAWERFTATRDHLDAILADLTMPKMTGKQLARKIRQTGSQLPMILTTGMASEAGPQEDQEGLFAAVLPKPVKFGDLAGTLRRVLDQARKA
jgi:two-component system cell cycle sensor histidine kinase/response regulator CckA